MHLHYRVFMFLTHPTQSLSAAHLLAANVTSSHEMPASDRPALDKAERLEHPPKVETLLRSGSSTPPPEGIAHVQPQK